jgi:hypothetical protein
VTGYATEIEVLAELQKRRKDYIKAINGNTNRACAFVCRALGWNPNDDEKKRKKVYAKAAKIVADTFAGKGCRLPEVETDLEVIAQSIAPLQKMRNGIEKEMKIIAMRLPAWEWAWAVRGFGPLGFAVIVAECGDLSKYANPAKVWKRLGLAPIEKNGVTMAASSWRMKGGFSKDDWIAAGYSPRRRAEIYACVGEPLFFGQSNKNRPSNMRFTYREAYDRRRARTAETHPDWEKCHSHGDALRVMTKELLRDLWAAWNGREASHPTVPRSLMPSSAPFSGPVDAAPDQPST